MRPFAMVLCAVLVTAAPVRAQDDSDRSVMPPDKPVGEPIVGDPERPRGHFRVFDPRALDPEQAEAIYADLKDLMAKAYAGSGDPAVENYQAWRRYNAVPYLSSTHGNRYVNNYGNALPDGYARGEAPEPLPEGAVIAKDSFTVTEDGTIEPGALFVMEKMAPGFNPISGDWRYTMILPDGTVFGRTHGVNSVAVRYCIACHLAVEDDDHLYFVPPEFRAAPAE